MPIDMPLVLVDVTVTAPAVHRWPYAVLCDRPLDELCAIARANPKIFIFPFYTGPVESVPDFSSLFGTQDPDLQHIFKPWYVGNLSHVEEAIRQILDAYMIGNAEPVML